MVLAARTIISFWHGLWINIHSHTASLTELLNTVTQEMLLLHLKTLAVKMKMYSPGSDPSSWNNLSSLYWAPAPPPLENSVVKLYSDLSTFVFSSTCI